jgi:hypothetical protein
MSSADGVITPFKSHALCLSLLLLQVTYMLRYKFHSPAMTRQYHNPTLAPPCRLFLFCTE